jgi:hypothetical protein
VARKAGVVGDQDSTNRQGTTVALLAKRRKLLDLHYQDRISAEAFGKEEARLTRQIEGLRSEEAELETEHARRGELAERFEEVAELLRQVDVEAVWAAGAGRITTGADQGAVRGCDGLS